MRPVETTSGPVIGTRAASVVTFRGIPFAAAPLGKLRFRLPEPAATWSEPRRSTPTPAPLQPARRALGMRIARHTGEDCLHLNVFTPGCDDRLRPVLVWLFGGGYYTGDAADPLFDGQRLARRGDLVVVTFNYRLGALGFVPVADANAGLADQLRLLAWVRDNIRAFGGDPALVTVAGESAGAMSVCNLLTMPAARGLFHRAIAQSGAGDNVACRDAAERAAEAFLGALGDSPHDASARRLLDAQQHVLDTGRARGTNPLRPFVDGALLTGVPERIADRGADIPLLIGMNADEQRLYVAPNAVVPDTRLVARIARAGVGSSDATALLGRYRARFAGHRNPNAAILAAIETEMRYRQPILRYARRRGANTWRYRFEWRSPALRGWLGACHAIEIPFVFGNFDDRTTCRFVGYGEAAADLSARVMDHWIHFVRNGAAPWPRDTWQQLGGVVPPEPADVELACAWDEALARR